MLDIGRHVRPGSRVVLGDGCGTPRVLHGPLSRAAAGRDVRLVLGWMPAPAPDLDPDAFADIRVLMGGAGVRGLVEAGCAHVVPTRLSAVPALLADTLRPDLVVATVVEGPDGLYLGAEASYLRGLVDAGTPVVAVLSSSTPRAAAGPPLPADLVTVVEKTDEGPAEIPNPAPRPANEAIARRVAELVSEGARLQVGPGRLGTAIAAAVAVPVRVDSGLLPDPVVDLDERGLLLGDPVAAYLCGSRRLYDWADGRPILHPVEYTHDVGRLGDRAAPPLVAVNTALEIDLDGQLNTEGVGASAAGRIGGHPDFCAAGVRGTGLSVIALPAAVKGVPTLVERLGRPVTTPSHDVDVVVTEDGAVDLRGLDRRERREALLGLWGGRVREG